MSKDLLGHDKSKYTCKECGLKCSAWEQTDVYREKLCAKCYDKVKGDPLQVKFHYD